jgi:hypothetical protein
MDGWIDILHTHNLYNNILIYVDIHDILWWYMWCVCLSGFTVTVT